MDPYKNVYGDHQDMNGLHSSYGGNPLSDPNILASMQMNAFALQNGGGLGNLPPNDQNMNYYQEYCRLFIANVVLTTQMKELIAEKNDLLQKIAILERGGGGGGMDRSAAKPSAGGLSPSDDDKKSRIRRKAAEIERHYNCPNSSCGKGYGSEGSLIQHIKLKHPELTNDPEWKMKVLQKIDESAGSK